MVVAGVLIAVAVWAVFGLPGFLAIFTAIVFTILLALDD